MKIIIALTLVFSVTVFAKTPRDFNHAILQDVKTDIEKDEEKFRQKPSRGPASIQESQPLNVHEPEKIKKNIRQIGPNEW